MLFRELTGPYSIQHPTELSSSNREVTDKYIFANNCIPTAQTLISSSTERSPVHQTLPMWPIFTLSYTHFPRETHY